MKRLFRKKSSFSISIITDSAQLPEDWESFVPPDHFLSLTQLRLCEQAALPNIRNVYTAARLSNKLVAVAYFQVLQLQADHLNQHSVHPAAYLGWRLFTRFTCPSLLVAGHLFRHDVQSFLWHEELVPYDAFRVYEALIAEALQQECTQAVLVKDMDERLVPFFQHHAPQYLMLRNDISMELPIREGWTTLVNYEKALKHKYAQRFRKVRAAWKPVTIEELDATATREQAAILYALYLQVSMRQPVRLGLLPPDYLPLLKQQYPDTLRIWMVREAGKPVAFLSAWVGPNAFDMFYIGMDYARNDSLQLYFNVLYQTISLAIDCRKERLILGRTALDAKARLGCEPRYLATFLYIRNGWVRRFVQHLQHRFADGDASWQDKHPFK